MHTRLLVGSWRAATIVALVSAFAACFAAEDVTVGSRLADAESDASPPEEERDAAEAATPSLAQMRLEAKCNVVFLSASPLARTDAKGNAFVAQTVVTYEIFPNGSMAHFSVRVAKIDASCKLMWSRDYGPGHVRDLAVDAQGDAVVLASADSTYGGALDFGQGPLKGETILAKIATDGTTVWSRSLFYDPGGNKYLRGTAVAVQADASIAVAGTLRREVSFGSIPIAGAEWDVWLFVGRMSAGGQPAWVRTFTGPKDTESARVGALVDDSGDLFLTGSFEGRIDFGLGKHDATKGGSAFVAKLAGANGTAMWSRAFDRSAGYTLAAASQGHLLAGGPLSTTSNFGDGPRSGDGFFVDMDTKTGSTRWSRATHAIIDGVAKLDAERIVVTAERSGQTPIDLGGGIRDGGAVLGIHDRLGTPLWSAGWGGPDGTRFNSLDVDSRNNDPVAAGFFRDRIDFGLGPLETPDADPYPSAGFVVRFAFVDGLPQPPTASIVDGGIDAPVDAGPLHTWSAVGLGCWTGTMCGLVGQSAYCAGSNVYGAFGNGNFGPAPHLIPEPSASGVAFNQIAVGSGACGIDATGELYCWGPDHAGQVGVSNATCSYGTGDPGYPCQTVPVARFPSTKFRAVSVGENQTCAIATDDTLYCWGKNDLGALGYGVDGTGPKVLGGPYDAVSVGENFVCALDKAGAAWCWGGTNSKGELGANADGGTPYPDGAAIRGDYPSPVPMVGNHTFKTISAGTRSACAVDVSGVPYCWGENVKGKLGDGTTTDRSEPTPVSTPAGVTFVDVRMGPGDGHACGVATTGAVYCWGSNGIGQLGLGTADLDEHPVPALVSGLPSTKLVAVYNGSVCAVSDLGERWCWGYNSSSGQLGKGDYANAFSPVRVP